MKSVESVEPVLEEDVEEYVDKPEDQESLEEQDKVGNRRSYLAVGASCIQLSLSSTQLDLQIHTQHCFFSAIL